MGALNRGLFKTILTFFSNNSTIALASLVILKLLKLGLDYYWLPVGLNIWH